MRRTLALLVAASLAACMAETWSPAMTDRIEVIQGAHQLGSLGAPLDSTIVIRLAAEDGAPMVGAEVHWVVASGSGLVDSQASTITRTDGSGHTGVEWVLGLTFDQQTLKATTLDGVSVTVTAEARALALRTIEAGVSSTCGIDFEDRGWCWGSDIGDGDGLVNEPWQTMWRPREVAGDHRFRSLAAGQFFGCGADLTGSTWCWGENHHAQLGRPASSMYDCGHPTFPCSEVPVQVLGAPPFASVATALRTACGLTPAGEIWCWGSNVSGEAGIGAGTPRTVEAPTKVASSDLYRALVAGDNHFCAIRTDARVFCWGEDFEQALGNGETVAHQFTPGPILSAETFTALLPGAGGTCAQSVSQELYCWGYGFTWNGTPAVEPTIAGFSRVSADWLGRGNGLDQWGRLYRWWEDSDPQAIGEGQRYTALSSGAEHACALGPGGHPWCWGNNADGQRGVAWERWFDHYSSTPFPVGAPIETP